MLVSAEVIRDKTLRWFLEHSLYLAILVILIPAFILFKLGVVLPAIVEPWTLGYCTHWICAIYLMVNIVGNMIYGMLTCTSVKGKYLEHYDNKESWTFCAVCEILRPPRSWHCDTCRICILKRDHHCTFFACCVGYFNHRYFMCFVFYIFIAMIYAFYYNVQFLASIISWNHGFVIIKFVFPLASFVFDFGSETLYIFLVVINVIVGAFTGFLFLYHFQNLLKGKITPETKVKSNRSIYDDGWKNNIIEVFGYRWYLTWLSPFVNSPLPGDGIAWITEEKKQ